MCTTFILETGQRRNAIAENRLRPKPSLSIAMNEFVIAFKPANLANSTGVGGSRVVFRGEALGTW